MRWTPAPRWAGERRELGFGSPIEVNGVGGPNSTAAGGAIYDPIMSSRGTAIGEPLPYDEEFLYHLSRGSEFLIANRVGEAKEELERALVVQPRDAKGQDLLAGVYFRLGVYPRAIELWSALVDQHPDDVPLRVNLGLALLKTAQLEESVMHLTRATTLDEGHGRAWGYLGLALWREGRLDKARDAFVRGGQASMARRMEEILGISASGHLGASLSVVPPPLPDPLDSSMPRRPSIPPTPWAHADSTSASIDLAVLARTERVSYPPTLRTALDRWVARPIEGESFGVTESGVLLVTPQGGDVVVVRERALALRGIASEGKGPLAVVTVGRQAVVAAPEGHGIHTVSLGDDEILYVVERLLLAYDVSAGGETRTIEAGAVSFRVAQLRGRASVALCCARRPIALASAGEPLGVSVTRLVGWSGRLFPATTGSGDALVLRGEGTVLVA